MAKDFKISRKDIADVFGCSETTVTNRLNDAGYAPGKGSNAGSGAKKQSKKYCDAYIRKIRSEYGDRFEVLQHARKSTTFKCKTCGTIFHRTATPHGVICPNCAQDDRRRAREQKAKEDERNKQTRIDKQYETVQVCQHCGKEFHAYRKQKYCSQSCCSRHAYAAKHPKRIKSCPTCGKEFAAWSQRAIYCSKECRLSSDEYKAKSKHWRRFRHNHSHRARVYGVEYVSGITLDKVIERDGGKCWICGSQTSKQDKRHTEDGWLVVGATYPTIDHIIPMSKGGGHTWENVRLACKHCNELKGDTVIPTAQVQGL